MKSHKRQLRLPGFLMVVAYLTYHAGISVLAQREPATVAAQSVTWWDNVPSGEPVVDPGLEEAVRRIMAIERELARVTPVPEQLMPVVPMPPEVTLTAFKPKAVRYEVITPPMEPGEVVALGKQMSKARFGPEHWKELYSLWSKESGWDHTAQNPSSGACGIPQALPCSKMPGFPHNAKAQIKWGLGYISGRYGTPTKAWEHFLAHNWY